MTGAILYRRLAFIAIVNGPAGIRLAVVPSERCAEINKGRRRGFFFHAVPEIHPKAGQGRSQSIAGEAARPKFAV